MLLHVLLSCKAFLALYDASKVLYVVLALYY